LPAVPERSVRLNTGADDLCKTALSVSPAPPELASASPQNATANTKPRITRVRFINRGRFTTISGRHHQAP
jgi:hypothetical protein